MSSHLSANFGTHINICITSSDYVTSLFPTLMGDKFDLAKRISKVLKRQRYGDRSRICDTDL